MEGHLFSTLGYAHARKLSLTIHTKFGTYRGYVDAINRDAVTVAYMTPGLPFPNYTTIAIHAIHVIEWADVALEPRPLDAESIEPQAA